MSRSTILQQTVETVKICGGGYSKEKEDYKS